MICKWCRRILEEHIKVSVVAGTVHYYCHDYEPIAVTTVTTTGRVSANEVRSYAPDALPFSKPD